MTAAWKSFYTLWDTRGLRSQPVVDTSEVRSDSDLEFRFPLVAEAVVTQLLLHLSVQNISRLSHGRRTPASPYAYPPQPQSPKDDTAWSIHR